MTDAGEKVVELRYVKFQRVNSLQIFVVDNQEGGEVTRIDSLDIFGQTVEATKYVLPHIIIFFMSVSLCLDSDISALSAAAKETSEE
jgi:hypothetical protein